MRDTTEGFIYGILVMTVLYMFGYCTGQYWLYVAIVGLILICIIIDHVYQKGKSNVFTQTQIDASALVGRQDTSMAKKECIGLSKEQRSSFSAWV
jgi:hypothetical protein